MIPLLWKWARRIAQSTLTLLLPATAAFAAERIPWTTSRVVGSPEPPSLARVERVFPGLTFRQPLDLQHEPRGKRWWVAQETGQLLSFPDEGDPKAADPVLDLREFSKPFNQLLGFTFDPDFARNGFVYLAYVRENARPDGSRISRFTLKSGPTPTLDPASELVILSWLGGGHNGCCLRFGRDRMLYLSTGDGSSPEPADALNTGQSLDDLLSAILRIDVRNASTAEPYRVPKDNPFVQRAGARPEIWAYGFRNPWRMNFARDGSLWVGDVGWELWETVHRVTPGYNGGWSRTEGPHLMRPDTLAPTPVARPAAAHGHHEAASITGGDFYSGSRLRTLRGHFLYGDWETGKIWSLNPKPGSTPLEIADTTLRVVSFAPGPDHEMYVLDYQGGLHLLAPNPPASTAAFPTRLSQTGLFADTARQIPNPGVVPYTVAAGRWHDGATASRWIAIPGREVAEPGPNYRFPAGTVFAKTLSTTLTPQAAGTSAPLETQLLHLGTDGWRAYTYHWNPEGTDAVLVGAAGDSAPSNRGSWKYGARADCLRCHNSWSGFVLGFNSPQLAAANSLPSLVSNGIVKPNDALKPAFQLAATDDPSASLELRARTWLHVQCAACHRFGAGGAVAARFAADEARTNLNVVDIKPTRGDFNLPSARIIAPGHPERSAAWYRINTSGAGHMPPVGSHLPDPSGSRLVADWIRSLASDSTRATQPANAPTNALSALQWLDTTLPKPPPESIVRQALSGTDLAARDLLAAYAPAELRRSTLGDRIDTESLLRLRGNAGRGKDLFLSASGPGCARCHSIETGVLLSGPSLAGIGRTRKPREILTSIVSPSASIAPGFQWHEGELNDGTDIAGFLVRRSSKTLQLRLTDGKVIDYDASQLKRLNPLASSVMPEGLLAGLTAQEAADLLAFLEQLR